ncbi:MAG: hypothetical protein WCZ90_07345 [Melioribacteraceae bacterium]
MEEFENVAFKFFSVLLNMTDYMEKSSASLMNLLQNYEATTAQEYKQKDEYHKVLNGINSRAKKVQDELLSLALKKTVNVEKKLISQQWFKNLTQELEKLNVFSKDELSKKFFIDMKGKLNF